MFSIKQGPGRYKAINRPFLFSNVFRFCGLLNFFLRIPGHFIRSGRTRWQYIIPVRRPSLAGEVSDPGRVLHPCFISTGIALTSRLRLDSLNDAAPGRRRLLRPGCNGFGSSFSSSSPTPEQRYMNNTPAAWPGVKGCWQKQRSGLTRYVHPAERNGISSCGTYPEQADIRPNRPGLRLFATASQGVGKWKVSRLTANYRQRISSPGLGRPAAWNLFPPRETQVREQDLPRGC